MSAPDKENLMVFNGQEQVRQGAPQPTGEDYLFGIVEVGGEEQRRLTTLITIKNETMCLDNPP